MGGIFIKRFNKAVLCILSSIVIITLSSGFAPVKYVKMEDLAKKEKINADKNKQSSAVILETDKPAPVAPFIIGHRGCGNVGVENTIAAIDAAVAAKAKFAEIDVILTKDSVPIVMHDGYLDRLAGKNLAVSALTYAELKAIPLHQNNATGYISSLEEIIKHCNGKIGLVIDYKQHGYETTSVVDKTMEVVKKFAVSPKENIYFQSFNYAHVEEMHKKYSDYIMGYLINEESMANLPAQLKNKNIDFISAYRVVVNPAFVAQMKAEKKPLYVWTVNDEHAIINLLNMGVDGIITDYPDLIVKNKQISDIVLKK